MRKAIKNVFLNAINKFWSKNLRAYINSKEYHFYFNYIPALPKP